MQLAKALYVRHCAKIHTNTNDCSLSKLNSINVGLSEVINSKGGSMIFPSMQELRRQKYKRGLSNSNGRKVSRPADSKGGLEAEHVMKLETRR